VGGIQFSAAEPIEKGARLMLELNLPVSRSPVRVSAEVVWVSKLRGSGAYRIATRFGEMNPSERRAIRLMIERMARDKRMKGLVNRKRHVWRGK
jgi:hypothetical protein